MILNDADGATAQAWYLLLQNLWRWQLNFKCSGSVGLPISSYTPCSTPQYVGEPTNSDFSGAGGPSLWWARWWRRRCSARRRRCTPSSWWPEVKTVRLRNLPPRDLSASPKSLFVTHTDHICDTHWSYLWHTLIICWFDHQCFGDSLISSISIDGEECSLSELHSGHNASDILMQWDWWHMVTLIISIKWCSPGESDSN